MNKFHIGHSVMCLKSDNDGCGNRIHRGQIYQVKDVVKNNDSNGDKCEVGLIVTGVGINPAAYPYIWNSIKFDIIIPA